MLRHFRSGVPEPKIPQRFFGGIGRNKNLRLRWFDGSASSPQAGSPRVRAGHSSFAKRLKPHFFPEGRFMIFAGSRPGGMLQKS